MVFLGVIYLEGSGRQTLPNPPTITRPKRRSDTQGPPGRNNGIAGYPHCAVCPRSQSWPQWGTAVQRHCSVCSQVLAVFVHSTCGHRPREGLFEGLHGQLSQVLQIKTTGTWLQIEEHGLVDSTPENASWKIGLPLVHQGWCLVRHRRQGVCTDNFLWYLLQYPESYRRSLFESPAQWPFVQCFRAARR
jgi:hypothetical protein